MKVLRVAVWHLKGWKTERRLCTHGMSSSLAGKKRGTRGLGQAGLLLTCFSFMRMSKKECDT